MVHCGIIMIKQLDLLIRKNHDAQIILDSIEYNSVLSRIQVNRCVLSVLKSRCASIAVIE